MTLIDNNETFSPHNESDMIFKEFNVSHEAHNNEVNESSITEIFSYQNPYHSYRKIANSWPLWVLVLSFLLFIEIIGNLFLFTNFAYEKFGMDPKKRTIINQLFSQLVITIICFNITVLPIISMRFLNIYSCSSFCARIYIR